MLAGRPTRISPAVDTGDSPWRDGFIKLRLCHSRRGSVIYPDLVFVKDGPWRFLQPSFFGPPVLVFDVEPGLHGARFNIDVGRPRSSVMSRLEIQIRSDQRVMAYADGAQMYACRMRGVERFAHAASGRCRRLDDGDFSLELFHHTNPAAFAGICASQELWSSPWNLQGTRRLINVAYVYLTSLPRIERPADLNRIAMASDGVLRFQTTSMRSVEDTVELKVYRESTSGRTKTVPVAVPTAILAPPHLYFHPLTGEPAYYEVVGPEIYRVGLLPGAKLAIPRGRAEAVAAELKRFEYVVMGNTGELVGLKAPYDEEDTEQVMHLERLEDGSDLFNFWQAHQNSDQVSGRTAEPRALEADSA